ncbi:MAG TPA: hypothetical protein PKD85_15550 [Saprospiraceae bacterium]|nr:hypothetical protein [Saprospiraceae bacterium]
MQKKETGTKKFTDKEKLEIIKEVETNINSGLINIKLKNFPSFYGTLDHKNIRINSERFILKTSISISFSNIENLFDEDNMIHFSLKRRTKGKYYYLREVLKTQ